MPSQPRKSPTMQRRRRSHNPKTMNKEIRYKGIALTPDPAAQPDGTLAVAANAEIHNGAVRPFVLAGTSTEAPLTVGDDIATLIYVHRTTAYTHLIATVGNNICWFHEDGTAEDSPLITTLADITAIESIGNTLVVAAASGIHYVVFLNDTYKYLGQQPPFIELQFQLRHVMRDFSDQFTVKLQSDWKFTWDEEAQAWQVPEEAQAFLTEEIAAKHNKHIANLTEEGLFTAPFLIRYCYRLYDGSMVMHSAPVAMYTTLYHTAMAIALGNIGRYDTQTHTKAVAPSALFGQDLDMRTFAVPGMLQFRCLNVDVRQQLREWSDIVTSIDIFITPQQHNYDTSQKIKLFDARVSFESPGVWDGYMENESTKYWADNYNDITVPPEDINERYYFGPNLPEYSRKDFMQRLQKAAEFFLLHSFNINNIDDEITNLWTSPFSSATIKNIAVQEQMKDDYKTHNILRADCLFSYNQRINSAGVAEQLFGGFSPLVTAPYVEGDYNVSAVYVIIYTDSGYRMVKWQQQTAVPSMLYFFEMGYFFYPDSRARFVIVRSDTIARAYKLYSHDALNGAYRFYNGDGVVHNMTYQNDTQLVMAVKTFLRINVTYDAWSDMPNKIYTSEVNNPFFFPAEGINTVGIGKILGIAATTRALTQGQFGQFPLMVFATDGIWALSVSSSGTYSASHPISREVTTNPNAICQTDQQVLFVTERALNTVTEQNVNSISPQLDGAPEDFTDTIPTLLQYLNNTSLDGHEQLAALLQYTDMPVETLQTAHVIYDFAANRLLIIPPVTSVALPTQQQTLNVQPILTYSIPDNAYTTAAIPPVLTAINAYPHPYLQFTDGTVMCLNKPYPYAQGVAQKTPVLLVTRPMAFGQAMYNINDFTHNYQGSSTPVIILFGSNDLQSWHYIGRTTRRKAYYMPTRAYRYLRYAIVTTLAPDEQYISTLLDVAEKFHKL